MAPAFQSQIIIESANHVTVTVEVFRLPLLKLQLVWDNVAMLENDCFFFKKTLYCKHL